MYSRMQITVNASMLYRGSVTQSIIRCAFYRDTIVKDGKWLNNMEFIFINTLVVEGHWFFQNRKR